MAPICCLVRRLCCRRFSTSSIAAMFDSTFAKVEPWGFDRDHPYLPVPRGFPFSVQDYPLTVGFAREDEAEKTQILFLLNGNYTTNGSPSYDVIVEVSRGYWYAQLSALVLSNMWRIRSAEIGERRDHHIKSYEEILHSKGIDARKIAHFFAKHMGDN